MPKLSALLPWLDAHGVAIVGVLTALVAAWKSVPAPARARIELAFPRVAGAARFVASIAPDLLGAARVFGYQVLAGIPRASVLPTPVPFAPPRAVDPDAGPTARQRRASETQTMRAIDDGKPGLAAPRALMLAACVAFVVSAACALAGCPLPAPDGCTPRDTRCAPDGVPEVCSSTQRWTRGAPALPCPERSTCCRAASPYGGRLLHACVPPSACLPEQSAPTSAPSSLANTQ